MITRTIPVTTHGRYLIEPANDPRAIVIGFHGYGENAEEHLAHLAKLPGDGRRTLVAVQALHPFYRSRTDAVVASWMTRLDRELAIEDNVAYVRAVVGKVRDEYGDHPLAIVGFSQGVAMAYRAATSLFRVASLIVLGGDVPPDVEIDRLSPTLIGRGERDDWYTSEKMRHDVERLTAANAKFETIVFDGGHEWTDAFLQRAASFIDAHS